MKQNCLRCDHYLQCRDPAKSVIYVCSRFDTSRHAIEREAAILTDLTEHEIAPSGLFLPKSHDKELVAVDPNVLHGIDASEVIKKILTDKRLVSPDIRVPEDDFAKAPNFYTWCVSDKFLNQKPFVQQALISTKVFAEYCPCCSDVEWMNNARVDDSLSKFERKVALLEHGVCPYCKRDKLKLYKKYGLKLYIELALNAGQRSGKSSLLGMMFTYMTHRLIKLERPNEVYGLLGSTVLQATFVALTFAQAKDTLFDGFYGNLLSSPWFCIEEDTPILLANGEEVAIQDVQVGSYVKTFEGSEEVLNVFDNGIQECKTVTLENGLSITGTDEHLVRCLGTDGTSLVWKKISELTEDDYVVSVSQDA